MSDDADLVAAFLARGGKVEVAPAGASGEETRTLTRLEFRAKLGRITGKQNRMRAAARRRADPSNKPNPQSS